MTRSTVLIDVAELMRQLAKGDQPAILDVRWRMDQPDGRETYLAGHIPGAVYVSLEDELSDHSRTGRGRHPLPSGTALQTAARRWGLRTDQQVIVYDDWNRAGSARAWWVLTAAGIDNVRILDGGLAAWTAAGGALQAQAPQLPPGDVSAIHDDLYAGGRATLTAQQVSDEQVTVLLDARAPQRFRGEFEPVDPVAGHIPGARNVPSTRVLADDGSFLADADLRALWADIGVADNDVGVYCGSGVTASVVLAALSATGIEGALFPGSWSQWCSSESKQQSR